MEDQKTRLLAHFEGLFLHMRRLDGNYERSMGRAAGLAHSDPDELVVDAMLASTELKFNMLTHMHNFDRLLESFMANLDEKGRESVGEVMFLLDELRQNQAKINSLHATYHARLERLADPKNNKTIQDVDLGSLSANDMIIIAKSFQLFYAALGLTFPNECDNVPVANMKPEDMDAANKQLIDEAMGIKTERLAALGIKA